MKPAPKKTRVFYFWSNRLGKCSHISKLTREELVKGSDLALENAIKLLESADLVSSKEVYGHANSLVILALEEAIKSFVLYVYAVIPLQQKNLLCDVFSKHKTKHQVWAFIEMLNEMFSMLMEIVYKYKRLEANNIVKTDECGSLCVNEITNNLKQWCTEPVNSLEKIRDWYMEANQWKNIGLYVDYIDQNWVNPLDTSKSKYVESRCHVEKFIFNLVELRKVNQADLMKYTDHFESFVKQK